MPEVIQHKEGVESRFHKTVYVACVVCVCTCKCVHAHMYSMYVHPGIRAVDLKPSFHA